MTSRTHDLAAFTALNLIIITQKIPPISFSTAIASLGACLLGGLTPDIDEPASEFWQRFPAGSFFGQLFHPVLGGHRSISHSLLGIAIFSLIAKYLLYLASTTVLINMDIVWMSYSIGLISHLIMDSLTKEGVPLIFPIHLHFGLPPIKVLRIETGGIIEKLIIFPILFFSNGYLIYKYYPIYLNLVKTFIK